MNFTAGHFTFHYNICDAERGLYQEVRVKSTRHPLESDEYFIARILVFAHSYTENQIFSLGLYDESQPAIWSVDTLGLIKSWVEVSCPDKKKLRQGLRQAGDHGVRVYFYTPEQIEQFCQIMRGSKENWIAPVHFFTLDPETIELCKDQIANRISITATFVDDICYMHFGERELQTRFTNIDMWAHYQLSLERALG